MVTMHSFIHYIAVVRNDKDIKQTCLWYTFAHFINQPSAFEIEGSLNYQMEIKNCVRCAHLPSGTHLNEWQ